MFLPFKVTKNEAFTLVINDTPLNIQKQKPSTTTATPLISNLNILTWTPRSSSEQNNWSAVTWSPELALFCAVSTTGTNRVATSPDGITWTARTSSEQNNWNSVAWSPTLNLFCAVSSSGTNRVMTSPDGTTWTARSAAAVNSWSKIVWASGMSLFVALSTDGTDRIMTSANGTSWTSRTLSTGSSWTALDYSAGLNQLLLSTSSAGMLSSTDSITWNTVTGPSAPSMVWDSVSAKWITSTGFYSTNGLEWGTGFATSSAKMLSLPNLGMIIGHGISGGASGLVSVTYNGGTTWRQESPQVAVPFTGMAYSPSLGTIVGVTNNLTIGGKQFWTGTIASNTTTITVSKDGGSFNAASNSFTNIGNNVKTLTLTASEMNADEIVVSYHYNNPLGIEVEDEVVIYTGSSGSGGGEGGITVDDIMNEQIDGKVTLPKGDLTVRQVLELIIQRLQVNNPKI